jgi:hypothetical protein
MDISNYFRIVSITDNVLHVEAKGFASEAVVQEGGQTYLSLFKKAIDDVSARGPFIILADVTSMATLSEEASRLAAEMWLYAKKRGLVKAVEVVPSTLTELSLQKAQRLAGEDDFRILVRSMEEARTVVARLQREIAATTSED